MFKRVTFVFILNILLIIILSYVCGCNKIEKEMSLGHFAEVSGISISPNGKQLLFTGCGYNGYENCTVYRYDIDNNKLYRYMPKNNTTTISGARFMPRSSRFVFSVIPYDSDNKKIYDEIQLAFASLDGGGFNILTNSNGVKVHPVVSYDESSLVFWKGRMKTSGRIAGSYYDLYKYDLVSGTEKQLTRMEYYQVSRPYFAANNKFVVFAGDSPMRLPNTDELHEVRSFRDTYKKKHNDNIITACLTDGSSINVLPSPLFDFSGGAKRPSMAFDGTIFFEGRKAPQGFIGYFLRKSNGELIEINYVTLGIGVNDIILYENDITQDGKFIAILRGSQNSGQKFVRIIDLSTNKIINIDELGVAENINVR